MHILEIPVKVFSFERITLAEQVFWEMQSSEDQTEPVTPGTKPGATTYNPVFKRSLWDTKSLMLFRIMHENSHLIQ